MAFLNYEYKMLIKYSEPVKKCYFTIKAVPAEDFRQRCISYEVEMNPVTRYSESKDSFGNVQIIGNEGDSHSEYLFSTKGLVETYPVSVSGGINESTIGMYKYPHGKCIPGEEIKKFATTIEKEVTALDSNLEKCRTIMNRLHECMSYEKGFTDMETTAEEAFSKKKGVCQDYAHIFICLLRLFEIPARYVCGLIVGEGDSHAWVEAACGENFISFDPTYNQEITDEYIKIGVGRDALDCAINRGVMWGGGKQSQEITVKVDKYY